MIEDFVWRALAGGIGIALVCGPFGCFVVWRRMAYFGDALAHGALLGVVLAFAAGLDATLGVAVVCLMIALLLAGVPDQRRLASDTILGLLSHGALAIGLIAVSRLEALRVDLLGLLFGDILAIGELDLLWIFGGGAVLLGLLAGLWRPLLAVTVHEELARAEGVPVAAVRIGYTVALALVVALAMKVAGVLLVTALLIIPAAAARPLATTPERMALAAAGLGALAVTGGVVGSLLWDTPAGPSAVASALGFFGITHGASGVYAAVRAARLGVGTKTK